MVDAAAAAVGNVLFTFAVTYVRFRYLWKCFSSLIFWAYKNRSANSGKTQTNQRASNEREEMLNSGRRIKYVTYIHYLCVSISDINMFNVNICDIYCRSNSNSSQTCTLCIAIYWTSVQFANGSIYSVSAQESVLSLYTVYKILYTHHACIRQFVTFDMYCR